MGSVVLVEGVSDRVALEALAVRLGRDLDADGVQIVSTDGVHAFAKHMRRLGGSGTTVLGLYDAAERDVVCRAIRACELGDPHTVGELERFGFFVCDVDLEDELIRACGQATIEAVLAAEGDLPSFGTLQKQPNWRNGPFGAQIRRYFGAGARRKIRYGALLVNAIELDRMPRPLTEVLKRASSATSGAAPGEPSDPGKHEARQQDRGRDIDRPVG